MTPSLTNEGRAPGGRAQGPATEATPGWAYSSSSSCLVSSGDCEILTSCSHSSPGSNIYPPGFQIRSKLERLPTRGGMPSATHTWVFLWETWPACPRRWTSGWEDGQGRPAVGPVHRGRGVTELGTRTTVSSLPSSQGGCALRVPSQSPPCTRKACLDLAVGTGAHRPPVTPWFYTDISSLSSELRKPKQLTFMFILYMSSLLFKLTHWVFF